MKNKTILLLVGALSLTYLLTGCGNPSTPVQSGYFTGEAVTQGAPELIIESSDEDEPEDPKANYPMEETSQAVGTASVDYVRGTIEGNQYSSEWLDLRFTVPNGSSFYPDAGEDFEMFCQDDAASANVNIVIEDLPASIQFVFQYVDALESQLLADTEIPYLVLSDDNEVTLGGATYRAICFRAEYNGTFLYQTYFIRFIGDKVASISTTYTEAGIPVASGMIASFQPY